MIAAIILALIGLMLIAMWAAFFGVIAGIFGVFMTIFAICNPDVVGSTLHVLAWIWAVVSVACLFDDESRPAAFAGYVLVGVISAVIAGVMRLGGA